MNVHCMYTIDKLRNGFNLQSVFVYLKGHFKYDFKSIVIRKSVNKKTLILHELLITYF